MSYPARSTRRIQFDKTAHASFQRGVETLVDAIRPTLGPLPRTVAIDRPARGMTPELLDNGAIIARRVTQLASAHADPGAMYLRGLLWRIHEEVGDGTATAAVIFGALLQAGRRAIAAGAPAQRLRSHLEQQASLIGEAIDAQAVVVTDRETVSNLALAISHDSRLAPLLAEIIDLCGPYGRIDIRDSRARESHVELVEGAYFEGGVLSDAFLDSSPDRRAVLLDTVVLLADLELNDPGALIPAIEHAIETKAGGLLVVARSLSPDTTALLLANGRAMKRAIAVVKVPGLTSTDQQYSLDDLAIMTGASVYRAISGDSPRSISVPGLGRARRAWAAARQFGIIGGGRDAPPLRDHVRSLEVQLRRTEDIEVRTLILDRLGRFHRGSATLYIGGATATEQKHLRSTAERAINVLRHSLGSGVVPGGGSALLASIPVIEREWSGDCLVERWVREITRAALEAPARAIASNAGYEPSTIVARVRGAGRGKTFDARSGAIADAATTGIVDPVFVVREAVTRAIRAAALALTIDVVVHTRKTEISVDPE